MQEKVYRVSDYSSIYEAMQAVSKNGGGKLIVSKGTYETKPLEMCSNLHLHLEEGSKILFSDNPKDYPPVWTRWEGIECYAMHPLLYGANVENVKISGQGTIDGNGKSWWEKFATIEKGDRNEPLYDYEWQLAELNPDYKERTGGGGRPQTQFLRPPLIQFWKSGQISLEGITLKNSPFWTLHTVYCDTIDIKKVTILNPADAINTDAIDIDSSSNVEITDCLFDVGDDAVTLKSGSGAEGVKINRPTENVRVRNCTILSSHGGIAIGSETAGGIKNVEVSDCLFQGTQRGIRLKSRRGRGGTIENVCLKNLKMENCWCPIVLGMFFAPGVLPSEKEHVLSKKKEEITESTPVIQNITIENIQATGVRCTAAFIVGLPELPIQNVLIQQFKWRLASEEQLLETSLAEATEGLFHDDFRGIKTIHVKQLTINGKEMDECS